MISVMIHVLPSFAAAMALHASSADSARGRLLAWAATNVRKHVRGHAGKNAPKRFELHSDPAGKIEEEAAFINSVLRPMWAQRIFEERDAERIARESTADAGSRGALALSARHGGEG